MKLLVFVNSVYADTFHTGVNNLIFYSSTYVYMGFYWSEIHSSHRDLALFDSTFGVNTSRTRLDCLAGPVNDVPTNGDTVCVTFHHTTCQLPTKIALCFRYDDCQHNRLL